ncbi:hypothetical protein ACFX2B_022174 [Malus domestica]
MESIAAVREEKKELVNPPERWTEMEWGGIGDGDLLNLRGGDLEKGKMRRLRFKGKGRGRFRSGHVGV